METRHPNKRLHSSTISAGTIDTAVIKSGRINSQSSSSKAASSNAANGSTATNSIASKAVKIDTRTKDENPSKGITSCVVHTPMFKSTRDENGKYHETRKHCMMCRKRINTFCRDCSVALCFGDGKGPQAETCWEKYHILLIRENRL